MDDDFVYVDGEGLDTAEAYRLVIGCVVPRPIAWITTIDAAGRVNAAPFSSYNYVATSPPMVAVNIATRDGEVKDTARNLRASGEFVVNVANEATMELMHACGANYAADESEAEALGLHLLASRRVAPPRIAATPVQMECRLDQAVVLGRGVLIAAVATVGAARTAFAQAPVEGVVRIVNPYAPGGPSGRTLLLATVAPLVVQPAINPALPYDAKKGFALVGMFATVPNLISVHPSVPANDLAGLIAHARATRAGSTTRRPAPAPDRTWAASCSAGWLA